MDLKIVKLRIGIRMKKFYFFVFTSLVNVTVQNAWLLYRKLAKTQQLEALDFLHFTRHVALVYLSKGEQERSLHREGWLLLNL